MSQPPPASCSAFSWSMWVLGLFALVQLILLGAAMRRDALEAASTPAPRIIIAPAPVPPTPLPSPSTKRSAGSQETDLDELIDRLDIDLEATILKATQPKAERRENGKTSARPPQEPDAFGNLSEDLRKNLAASRLLRQKGDLARALLGLEKLKEQHPSSPPILYELALAYEDLGNAPAARRVYMEIFKLGHDLGGSWFVKASHKLQHGFGDPAKFVGRLGFGHVRQNRESIDDGQTRIQLSIPVQLEPGLEIDPTDLQIDIDFYDRQEDGDVVNTRGRLSNEQWLNPPADWASGEEILLVELTLPNDRAARLINGAGAEYHGFLAKLFYKGEPLDALASPRSLFITRKKFGIDLFPLPEENFLEGGLLPDKDFDVLPEQ